MKLFPEPAAAPPVPRLQPWRGRWATARRQTAARRPVWTDRWALGLALVAAALDAALALVLWQRYEALPELIAIHFNAFGEADLIGGRQDIFWLPLIGALVWAANGIVATVTSPYDRVLARTLLGAALVVQALLCLAAWRILT
jgi:hypothetical protein